jgi:hypothetical protein
MFQYSNFPYSNIHFPKGDNGLDNRSCINKNRRGFRTLSLRLISKERHTMLEAEAAREQHRPDSNAGIERTLQQC